MKKKVSITLSAKVLAGIDQLGGAKHSRSAVIERALQDYLRERARADVEARDLELIDRAADRLNLETAAVLDYQVIF
jgi:metal-responsive CopG/Arc/MetJ family transcriptional regulator